MDENFFDKLREMTGKHPERLTILEHQIDVKLQMEYFKYSRKLKKGIKDDADRIIDQMPDLYIPELTNDVRREILCKLASIDNPRAFRIIEQYVKDAPPEMHDWAVLAMQESKMLIESNLLEENQIFISTGLGGKGNMLRYFIVLIGDNLAEFDDLQKGLIRSEFDFGLRNNKSVLEWVEFDEKFATMMALIPFDVPFQSIFRSALDECNQFGQFLLPNFLVTNVKALTIAEIKEFLEKNDLPQTPDDETYEIEPLNDNPDDEP
jgi:hypothetical protein